LKEEFLILNFIFVISGYGSEDEEEINEVTSNVTDLMERLSINNDDVPGATINLDDKVFHADLLWTTPTTLKLEDLELVIFELEQADDLPFALQEFEDRIAEMEIAGHYNVYYLDNLLVFVVADNMNNIEAFEKKYDNLLDKVSN